MKNLNLIKRLWTDSHEKLKVRGVQKYCILLLLLFTCVTHAWAATRRLYYDNSTTKWASVSCYCWKNGGANDQDWPGKSMTQIAGTNIWYRDVTNDNCDRCIFNNSNNEKQTSDQTIPSDKNKCTYDGNSTVSWSTYQVSSSASLSATSTSIGIGATSTLTPSLSSNSSHNEIKSTSYSVTTNPGSAGSVTSAGVFSATSAGTYTVTATVTYNAKGFSGITSTTTATKQITVYDYIYFYAAIPNGWDNRTTTVRLTSSGSSALTPYDNTSLASTTKNASSPCVPVYSAVSSTSYYNGGAKYNVYIYKVLESDAGKNVYLGHSEWTFGTAIGTVAAGKLYTLTSGDNGGTYMTANAISVNSVTASGPYAINAVSLTSSISAYGTSTANLRTAGGDTFTTTYTLNDVTASTSTVITPSVSNTYTSNTGNLVGTITIDEGDLTAGHTYTLTVKVADNITGKMTSSATSSSFAVTAASIATLTYHANYRTESGGGSGSAPAADEVSIGGTATVAGKGSMTWDTYTFVGWNTEEHYSGSGTLYKEEDKIEMDEDLDLYGMWTRPIPLDDQGATKAVVGDVYGTYNSSYLPPYTNPEKTGYTFNGWYTKPGGANNEVITKEKAFTKDNTNWTSNYLFSRPYTSTSSLYAKWTQTVTLNANTANHGVSPNRSATATWNATSVSSMTHTTAATGYRLDGYYTAATGGTKIINSDKSLVGGNVIVSGDTYLSSGKWQHAGATTLWAQYTPIQYTITFNPNGGSVDPTSRSVTYDAAITNAPVPTKTGYNFTGYNTAGGVSITTNAGVFKANVDGFTDASAHWIKTSGATITAQWTAKTTTVTLDPQSGSGGTESVTATYGSAMPSATMPTRTGYTFGGYYTNTGGAGTPYYTNTGASANNWNFEDATKTLYAKWTATTYYITYNLNDGANPGGVATSFTIESALITLPTPSRTGYTFGGWYGNSSFTGSAITTIAAGSTGNKEYWAKWTPKNYSITYDPVSAPEGVTYTTTPSNANCDATVDMVFTPTGDNTVIVSVVDGSSNPVAVTNPSANTYRFTMPASNVTVHVSVQSLPIVYVLKTKNASAYIPFGFTSAGSASDIHIWAWKPISGNPNFYDDAWTGPTADSKATEYTDAHGNVWWRFVPENEGFTRSTEYCLILHSGGTKIYESDKTHHISDGVTRTECNGSTNASFTGTVWVVPGGTGEHTATLYYENPSSNKKFCFVEGRFKVYTDKSRITAIYTGSNEGDWNETSRNIRMMYDETNSRYYLHTYCTPNELKSINSNPGYINLHTSSVVNNFTDDSRYYLNTSGQNLTEAGQKRDFTSTSSGHRPYITSTVTNKYVVLYWDESKLWYEEEPIPAQISSISLSASRVPPMAEIIATPNMSVMGTVDQAYCWGVYSDEECTSPVNVSFTSLGSGRVQFTVPQTIGTYYLKLTVRASAACNASIDDEEVQSFNVTTDNMVFFNKTDIPWSGVFVYFLGDGPYWDDNLGSGCASKDYGKANEMHRIGKTDIYYYEYSGNALGNNDIQYIAFTEYGKPSSEHFAYVNAAYRGDFKRSCAPMYVPENWITHRLNDCKYYNRGYWTTYGVSGVARNAGFTLKVYNAYDDGSEVASEVLTNTDGSNTYRATVNLTEVNYQYGFLLVSCANQNYGNSGKMVAGNSSGWDFEVDKHRCGVESQASGKYEFIVQCNDNGKLKVTVEYPLMNRDYRLIYNDTCVYQTGWHPSQFIRHNYSDGAKLDTVSMYIRPNKQPTLKIQVCDNASSNPPTWRDSITYDVSGLTNGHGVYNFYLSQEDGKLTINGVRPYTGLYYIRTQQADGGWTGYKTNSDNVMTYTEYAEQKNYGFNYYMTKWIGATGADVTFTIACDYSESLCDTMVADPGNNPLNESQARSIPHSASVRFGWNSLTNTLHRAYINGSSIVSDRYLVMIGDEKLKDSEGEALDISGLNANEIGFTDLNNWIYRCDVTAVEGAKVKLIATYDSYEQYFIGTSSEGEEIIGGTDTKEYLMRVTYDFKTNRLMTAWLPNGAAITSDVELKADMMLIREGQNAATQVYFGGTKENKITDIHTIFGVMQFNYSDIVGKFSSWSSPNAYKFLMYYVSFPFDVKVSEIFGAGVRGKNWIIQKYNGAKRAQIGWFAETSTFWETLPGDSILHANEGYMLILDRVSFNNGSSSIWTNLKDGNSVYLYFPSASRTVGTIKDDNEEVPIKIPSHTCIIERPFTPDIDGWSGGELVHSNTDSHWNVFGTPLFQSKAATTVGESELKYFYSWNYTDNTLRPRVTLTGDTVFKSMHGYMVQFAGNVIFTGAHISASVAARRMPSNKHYLAELQLVNENGDENATYVELRENANTDFQLNEDMYMMRSSNTVDLYSFAGAYDVAANVLPIDDQLVRVGVDVKRAGTYRFTMPSEFSGTVTLIDNLMGTRTNMALGDHEVYLERGVDNNRFLLEININKMPTAIDGVDGGSLKDGKAHKFIENGQMYILKDGIIYDARGARVK